MLSEEHNILTITCHTWTPNSCIIVLVYLSSEQI